MHGPAGHGIARAAWPYLASFVVLGLTLNFLGPALSTLEDQTGSSTRAIAILFVTQSAGYLVGSLAAGRNYDRDGGHRWAWRPADSTSAVTPSPCGPPRRRHRPR